MTFYVSKVTSLLHGGFHAIQSSNLWFGRQVEDLQKDHPMVCNVFYYSCLIGLGAYILRTADVFFTRYMHRLPNPQPATGQLANALEQEQRQKQEVKADGPPEAGPLSEQDLLLQQLLAAIDNEAPSHADRAVPCETMPLADSISVQLVCASELCKEGFEAFFGIAEFQTLDLRRVEDVSYTDAVNKVLKDMNLQSVEQLDSTTYSRFIILAACEMLHSTLFLRLSGQADTLDQLQSDLLKMKKFEEYRNLYKTTNYKTKYKAFLTANVENRVLIEQIHRTIGLIAFQLQEEKRTILEARIYMYLTRDA